MGEETVLYAEDEEETRSEVSSVSLDTTSKGVEMEEGEVSETQEQSKVCVFNKYNCGIYLFLCCLFSKTPGKSN